MGRMVGTIVRGILSPIFKKGDDVVKIVTDTVLNAAAAEGFEIRDRDIIAVTESVIARAQGNYAGVDDIAEDIRRKFGKNTIGIVFPILSRNRFALCLKGVAKGAEKIILMLSYPADEVGNHLINADLLDEKCVNPWVEVFTEKKFREYFGYGKHTFTGIDYIDYYKSIMEECGTEYEIILSNNPKTILEYTKSILVCDIHTRNRTKKILLDNGAEKVYGLDDILSSSVGESGYNELYGLLGSNKATEDSVKLFPRDCPNLVEKIQEMILQKTGKTVEVMVFGDGAFKDPVGKIWELADPVVSPGYTKGLEGTPNEVKLKYLADNNFAHLNGEELKKAISEYIKNKNSITAGSMESQGTTPRRLPDLIGSLCDLTSGSGDKGTPIIYIQGYFDSYVL